MTKERTKKHAKKWLTAGAITAAVAITALSATSLHHTPSTDHYNPTAATKMSGCIAAAGIEDKACTPGAVIASATTTQICKPGYASSVRNVPESEKNQVYAEYGIATHTPGEYEVDHLISLELGGSNDIANLWPEAANPTPGFHQKDQVENYLHKQVCDGQLSLKEAQRKIATNWLQVYPEASAH